MENIFYFWLALLIGGITLIAVGYAQFKRNRASEDIATSRSDSAAMGQAELQGYAWPETPHRAPIAQREVAFFILTGFRRATKDFEVEVFRYASGPFFMVDAHGCIRIAPESDTTLQSQTARSIRRGDLDERQRQTLSELEIDPALFESATRIEEHCLEIGAPLYALGSLHPISNLMKPPAPAPGLYEFMRTRRKQSILEYLRSGKKFLHAVDAPWREQVSERGLRSLALVPPDVKWETCYGLLQRQRDGPLFLADRWEESLIMNRWQVFAYIASGSVLLATALAAGAILLL